MLRLTILLFGVVGTMASAQTSQRLPRQKMPQLAAVQGIIRNEAGLGLGGVAVRLRNVTTAQALETRTTGDGVFRFLNLSPGQYELKAEMEGREPQERGQIQLYANDVFAWEVAMKAIP